LIIGTVVTVTRTMMMVTIKTVQYQPTLAPMMMNVTTTIANDGEDADDGRPLLYQALLLQ
jgi:hypothetical protein